MGLQIWLPLNGNLINQGLDGTTTITNGGATVNTNGKIGQCYAFDGTQYIKVQSPYLKSYLCNSSVPFTMACWIYLNTDETDRAIIFGGYNANPFINWELMANCTQILYAGGTSNYTGKSNGTVIPKTTWTHIAVTYDGNNTTFFMNGNKLSSTSGANTIASALGSNIFYLGSDARSGATRLKGRINDFRFYDCALSLREIKEISKGLVLHYPLNREGFGVDNILTNSSGYEGTTNWSGLVTVGEENNQKYLIAKRTDTTSNSRTFCTHTAITSLVSSWSPGDAFTISGYYKVPSTETYGAQGNMFIRWTHSTSGTSYTDTGFSTVAPSGIIKDEWIRFENTYTVPANYQNGAVNFYLSAFAKALSTIYWKDVKLEKGSHATPWIPASSDELYSKMGLDENVVYDVSGYKYNGTIINGGISYSGDTPRYQISTEFDGITGAIRVPFNDFVTNGDIFTLNLWWKKTELGSKNYETLFGGPSGFEMDTRAGGASTLSLYMASTRGSNVFSPFNFNEWYMVTLVNDGTNELYYVNGELKKTIKKKAMPTGVYRIGAWASDTGQNYKGLISDFRIYKTALSADDILELYHTPITLSNNGTLLTQGEYSEV